MRKKWTKELLFEEALKYNTRGAFRSGNAAAARASTRRGIFDEICSHMLPAWQISSGENSALYVWDDSSLYKEALKYSTRIDFMRSGVAYQAAYKRGILDQICVHMGESPTHPWKDCDIKEEALKYKSRAEFENKSLGAYQAARKRHMLDEICQHMSKDKTMPVSEKDLMFFIKSKYPNAIKLRDRKVKIESKPHIKGFDVDIFVPESNRGIEFDGTYWHSFEKMRSDPKKKSWPDEDVLNYHQIKDDYFFSRGIRIIHITDKEWIEDKEKCIEKCLTFLDSKHGF